MDMDIPKMLAEQLEHAYRTRVEPSALQRFMIDELMAGMRPMCNRHSLLGFYYEYHQLADGSFTDIADGVFHEGTAYVIPVLFPDGVTDSHNEYAVAQEIEHFLSCAKSAIAPPQGSITTQHTVAPMSGTLMAAMICNEFPITPQAVAECIRSSHAYFHHYREFPESSHDEGFTEIAVKDGEGIGDAIERWINGFTKGTQS